MNPHEAYRRGQSDMRYRAKIECMERARVALDFAASDWEGATEHHAEARAYQLAAQAIDELDCEDLNN